MTSHCHYRVDEQGCEILLASDGGQVMMEWEKEYMEKCVDSLKITSDLDVLEIGFGCGYSSNRIQSYQPRSHTIIECDPIVLKRLQLWSEKRSNVRIVFGTWQNALCSLGYFDCIFFDDYPLPEIQQHLQVQHLQVQHPQEQYQRKCLELDQCLNENHRSQFKSRWHDFLDEIIPHHIRHFGRISGYLARDLDFTRKNCQVEMKDFQVKVAENCRYFPYSKAIVPVITYLPSNRSMDNMEKRKSSSHSDRYKKVTNLLYTYREEQAMEEEDDDGERNKEEKLKTLKRQEYIKILRARKLAYDKKNNCV